MKKNKKLTDYEKGKRDVLKNIAKILGVGLKKLEQKYNRLYRKK